MFDLNLNPSPKELRWFAALQIAFFALISVLMWRGDTISVDTLWYIVGVSTLVGIAGVIQPAMIRWIYVVWMLAVFPIGWVVSHVLVAVVFYLVVTPIGLIRQVVSPDPMQRKFDPQAQTYWQPRKETKTTERYFRQF